MGQSHPVGEHQAGAISSRNSSRSSDRRISMEVTASAGGGFTEDMAQLQQKALPARPCLPGATSAAGYGPAWPISKIRILANLISCPVTGLPAICAPRPQSSTTWRIGASRLRRNRYSTNARRKPARKPRRPCASLFVWNGATRERATPEANELHDEDRERTSLRVRGEAKFSLPRPWHKRQLDEGSRRYGLTAVLTLAR